MIGNQGETSLVLEYNSLENLLLVISSNMLGESFSNVSKKLKKRILAFQYVLACDLPKGLARKLEWEQCRTRRAHSNLPGLGMEDFLGEGREEKENISIW